MTAHLVVEALALRRSKSPKEPHGCVLLVNWHALEVQNFQNQYAYTYDTANLITQPTSVQTWGAFGDSVLP